MIDKMIFCTDEYHSIMKGQYAFLSYIFHQKDIVDFSPEQEMKYFSENIL